mmetsp:Transcript_81414/g.264329  ORF Transcript_81414/g.264329 Transcript_81414/m.264329 type:complete len:355 (+) Transcript_81414:206-1270(+)
MKKHQRAHAPLQAACGTTSGRRAEPTNGGIGSTARLSSAQEEVRAVEVGDVVEEKTMLPQWLNPHLSKLRRRGRPHFTVSMSRSASRSPSAPTKPSNGAHLGCTYGTEADFGPFGLICSRIISATSVRKASERCWSTVPFIESALIAKPGSHLRAGEPCCRAWPLSATAAKTTSRSACNSGATCPSANPFTDTAFRTKSLSSRNSGGADARARWLPAMAASWNCGSDRKSGSTCREASPVRDTASTATSTSRRNHGAANCSASPFWRTARSTTWRSARATGAAYLRARPFWCTALSTTSLSACRSAGRCFSALPSQPTAQRPRLRSPRSKLRPRGAGDRWSSPRPIAETRGRTQ